MRFDGTNWARIGNALGIATVGTTALTALNGTDVAFIDSTNDSLRAYRTGAEEWILNSVNFLPTLSAPTGLAVVAGGAGTLVYKYQVSAAAVETYEESMASAEASCNCVAPTAANPNVLTWTLVPGAQEYYVYRETYFGSSVFGYLGTAAAATFKDVGIAPYNSGTPPVDRGLFAEGRVLKCVLFQIQGLGGAKGVITADSDQLLLAGSLDAEKYPNTHVNFDKCRRANKGRYVTLTTK